MTPKCVAVKNGEAKSGYTIIGEDDYDPNEHEIFAGETSLDDRPELKSSLMSQGQGSEDDGGSGKGDPSDAPKSGRRARGARAPKAPLPSTGAPSGQETGE